jgi:hypothetical protein
MRRISSDASDRVFRMFRADSSLEWGDTCEIVTYSPFPSMKESDYREVERSIAETLRVFLESKQKLSTFERSCRDSLTGLLGEIVRRRSAHVWSGAADPTMLHEGR